MRVGLGRREVHVRPGLLPQDSQRQNFRPHQHERADNHQLGAAREVLQWAACFAAGKRPHKKGENQLGRHERDPASDMVSFNCSSIACPCVEMSSGSGNMCVTIG